MRKLPSLGFSTIGCPEVSFEGACELADTFGLEFVELRSLEGTLDLPGYFRNRRLPAAFPEVRLLATSLSLLDATIESLASFQHFAGLSHRLHARYLRVFGSAGAGMGDKLAAKQLETAASTVREVRKTMMCNGWTGEILLETHDVFSSSERCLALNSLLDVPLQILWDSHHTWRLAGESPQATWSALGPLIRHIHYKDSVSDLRDPGAHRYVLPGQGEFPTGIFRELLESAGYTGGLSLEWEKLWHADLPGIGEALALFPGAFSKQKREPRGPSRPPGPGNHPFD